MAGDVVLTGEAAVGAVTGEAAVDEDGVDALGAAEVQHDLPARPTARDGERAAVHTGRVAIGKPRWRTVEGHLHVGVLRVVVDALHGPVSRHGQGGPVLARVSFEPDGCRWDAVGVVEQAEAPSTVERSPEGRIGPHVGPSGRSIRKRRRGRTHRQPVQRRHRRVGPGAEFTNYRKHLPSLPASPRFRRESVGGPASGVRTRSAAVVDPDRGIHRHQVGVPDPVHRRNTDTNAAVRGRVVRDAVRAVYGDATDEVLRAVDLAEVTFPPSFGSFAVHRRAGRRE